MTSFRRARSDEQREQRRRRSYGAAAMLREMPVADLSLNELSRRVGLAKSNVLRYYESREAVLLELCAEALHRLAERPGTEARRSASIRRPLPRPADRVAAVIAASLAERPVLCDLMSAQAAVLEHDVSTDTVLRYKRNAIANVDRLAESVAGHLPELGAENAAKFTALAALLATSTWTHAQPPPAVHRGVRVGRRAAALPAGIREHAPGIAGDRSGGSAQPMRPRPRPARSAPRRAPSPRRRHAGPVAVRGGHHLQDAGGVRSGVAVQRFSQSRRRTSRRRRPCHRRRPAPRG